MRFSHYFGIFLILLCLATAPGLSKANDQYNSLRQFSRILDLVESSYVRDVDREEIIQGAIKGMLRNLDPHSVYMDKETFQEMQVETKGEFTGVGIEITIKNNRLTVIAPIEDTPAHEAGIRAGDVILEINGESTQDITLMDAVHKIRGPKGSEVELTVLHPNQDKPEKIVVERDVIPMHSIKSQAIEPGYLYVHITNFNEKTTEELHQALEETKDELQGLILDLRNNPGGLLSQAVSVADTFLEEGKIVYTKGKTEQSQMEFTSQKQKSDVQLPMVVLINSGTASASEIVAGALQDHKKALVIGMTSFGKGSVQSLIPLSDGSGIKLTTAKYYTPKGRSIQAEGIVPDIKVPFISSEKDQTWHRSILREENLEGHLENDKTSKKEKKREREEKVQTMLDKDNQLYLALQLVKSLPQLKQLQ